MDSPRRVPSDPSDPPSASPSPPVLPRDPWAWASLAVLIPLVLHSLGAPLGEPVADDFDHLHYALFTAHPSLLDGGGSGSFWRPLAYQGYFGLFARAFLASRIPVVALHLALLGAAVLLFCRTARRFMPGPWAAVAASFPLLCESARALIAVPVHFVDVGLIAFSALSLHEAAAGRIATSLLGLAAAFGCKESALATALLLPWLAPARLPSHPRRAWLMRRMPWFVGAAAVTFLWAGLYLVVRARTGIELPRGLEAGLGTLPATLIERSGWAIAGTARGLFSLPLVRTGRDLAAGAALGFLFLVAALQFARDAAARERLARVAPVVIAGAIWCALATAPLVTVFPIWSPQRVVYGGLGAGVVLAAALGAAHPALLAVLVAIRLALFALAPGPPARITNLPPETGAFVDFERLIRVQRLVAETRAALTAAHPTLPPGARVGLFSPPLLATYAFGRSRALQTWYRDTTLEWMRYDEMYRHPNLPPMAVVTYQPEAEPQMVLLDAESFAHYLQSGRRVQRDQYPEAMRELALADSFATRGSTRQYRALIAGRRAFCWLGLDRSDEAEREARRSLALWSDVSDARYTLASVKGLSGPRAEAEAQLDSRSAQALRDSLGVWAPKKK